MRFEYLVFDCTVEIAKANQTLKNAKILVFPITINSNIFDKLIKQAKNASITNYILV